MKTTVFIPFLLIFLPLFSQNPEYRKGLVIDTIWVDSQKKESFSFYAPDSYNPNRPSPVVFIFEPMARGTTGILPFIQTADTYGYLLVCSNNSRNGPYNLNYRIVERLFRKISTELNIDPKRIYTSGFSGGARLATTLATTGMQVQGVLSCGAGLNLDSRGLPVAPNYSYAVIMGNEDMNYYELDFTDAYLRKIKLPHEIFTYDITHRWPDSEQILLAFDWMQLEAFKNRLTEVDSSTVYHIYKKFYAQARSKEKNDRLLSANNEYHRLMRNFRRYYDLDSIDNLSFHLQQSKAYRAQQKKHQALLETEKIETFEFLNHFGSAIDNNNFEMKWWENRIKKLGKNLSSKDWMEVKMFRRILYRIYANAMESANYGTDINSAAKKKYCYDICILVYPNYPVPYVRQIDLAIGAGQPDLAIDYLEKLLLTGYSAKDLTNNFPSVERLNNNPRYKRLMSTE